MKKDSPIYNREPDSKVLVQTTDWFDKVKSGNLTPDEEIEFFAWLTKDPAHQAEFDFMATIWDCTDVLESEPLPAREAKDNRSEHRIIRFPMFKPMIGLVAAMLIVVIVWMLQTDVTSQQMFRTVTGEQRTVYLKDGSIARLDAETVVSVDYTIDSRRIDLAEGRASFTVVHNPTRPFIVSVGNVFIRAVGTKFSVFKQKKGKVAVAVTEGQVKVTRQDPLPLENKQSNSTKMNPPQSKKLVSKKLVSMKKKSQPPQQVLNAGQKIIIEETRKSYKVQKVETKHISGWENGRLFFHKTPLEDVLEEINRYLEKKIVIGDARLNDLRISIIFKIRDRKYFLETLKIAIPITSKASSTGQIVILKKVEPFVSG